MMDFGKHALFIWTSYGVALSFLLLLTVLSWRTMRRREAQATQHRRERRT
jgi:heme exporter protein CcmD